MIFTRAKLKSREKKIGYDKKRFNNKNLFIDNDMTQSERQIQKNLRLITEVEKHKGAKMKIGYRKLQMNDKFTFRS